MKNNEETLDRLHQLWSIRPTSTRQLETSEFDTNKHENILQKAD